MLLNIQGSGGGSVGRVVASNTKDPLFESSHRQNFINQLYIKNTEKMKIKRKRPVMAPFKIMLLNIQPSSPLVLRTMS